MAAAVAEDEAARAPDSSAADEQRAVDEFVRGGGTVVAWNQGANSIISALHLPVRNVVAGLPRKEYFTGGSIMRSSPIRRIR